MKTFTGIVVSSKMDQTAVVKVDLLWQHPIYKKRVKRTKKYLIHIAQPVSAGQTVTFAETRPLSHRKHWKLVEVAKK